MPRSPSKKTVPLTTMRPPSGRMSPARHCSVSVLPAPEGPKRVTTSSPASQLTSSVKPGRDLRTSRERATSEPQAREAPEPHQEQRHGGHGDERERIGLGHAVGLDEVIDGERRGLGQPGNAARDNERDAKV